MPQVFTGFTVPDSRGNSVAMLRDTTNNRTYRIDPLGQPYAFTGGRRPEIGRQLAQHLADAQAAQANVHGSIDTILSAVRV